MKRYAGFVLFFAALLGGCHRKITIHSVGYSVKGTARAAKIVYRTGPSTQGMVLDAKIPWHKTIECPTDTPVILMAEVGPGGGGLHGEVTVDGKSLRTCDAQGTGALAQCGVGMLP